MEEKKEQNIQEVEAKEEKKEQEKDEKIELEREYVIPLRKEILKAPRYKRAKKAISAIRAFLAKHMKVENRDTKKVKINIYLNNEIWFRGAKKPKTKIKVKATKKNGVVYAEIAEIPKVIEYKISKELIKRVKKQERTPKQKNEEKEEKIEEIEKEKVTIEAGLEKQKQEKRKEKHTARIKHEKKTAPRRKALNK